MAKRKKRNKIFITLGILIVIIAAVVFFAHQFLFNNIDQEEKSAIDEEVERITQSIVEEIEGGDQNPSTGGEAGAGNEGDTNNSKDEEVSRTIASYENGFLKLKDQGNSIIDRLIVEVKEEYSAMKSSGGGKVDLTKLASSYTNKSKAYEDGLDSTLDVLITKMKADLLKAGMDEKAVQEYIGKVKNEYKKQKDERRKLLLDKAMDYL